jgi:hypothetical protein
VFDLSLCSGAVGEAVDRRVNSVRADEEETGPVYGLQPYCLGVSELIKCFRGQDNQCGHQCGSKRHGQEYD